MWYTYVCGREPDLKRTLNKMIGEGTEFSMFENAELFEKFFGLTEEGAQTRKASEQFDNSSKEVITFFSRAVEGTESYNSTLS